MGIFNVGVSGLGAAQAGILTTSHNIANASTPGYSRQLIQQTTNTPMFSGSGYLGQGTNVETIRRVYSQQLTEQVLSAQTGAAEMDSYLSQISQISNLLADPDAGLSPAMTDFFSAVQEMAANPASIPARQAMLSASQALVARFEAIDQRMTEVRTGVNAQISSNVSAINSYAQQIANINQRIISAQAAGPNQAPNDLLDQRDQLVADLNQLIRVTTIEQNDGTYSVFIGNGQPLVVGTLDYSMQAVAAPDDPERIIVAIRSPMGTTVNMPESMLSGGELGGLIAFRSESLDGAQNALGRIALTLATNFNTQHRLGQDLTGALGGDYFDLSLAGPTVRENATNTGSATVTASIDAATVDELTTSDYRLIYNGSGNYTVTRLSDNAVLVSGAPLPASIDGFSISVGGTPNVGDSFLIQPVRGAATNLSMAISDPRSIAAASPVRTGTPLTNTGSAAIDAGRVTDAAAWNAATNSKNLEVRFWTDTAGTVTTAGRANGSVVLPASTTINVGANDQFAIQVDGAASPTTITISNAGNPYAPANLVTAIQTALNTDLGVSPPAAGSATASLDAAGRLVITSSTTGASSSIVLSAVTGNTGFADLFGTPVSTGGIAASAGTTYYDLVDAATGNSLFTGAPSATGAGGSYTHAYTSGQPITLSGLAAAYNPLANDFGATFTVTGTPASGDKFTIERNANGVSDNRNGVLLAALQTQNTMSGGTATYQSAYSQIVADVGNKSRQVEITGQAQQSLYERAQTTRDQLSGVNLDEEAANLLRYQQAYQAAARMLDIASGLFDEILALGR